MRNSLLQFIETQDISSQINTSKQKYKNKRVYNQFGKKNVCIHIFTSLNNSQYSQYSENTFLVCVFNVDFHVTESGAQTACLSVTSAWWSWWGSWWPWLYIACKPKPPIVWILFGNCKRQVRFHPTIYATAITLFQRCYTLLLTE